MNEKFFTLPIDKQQQIINAAYKVFAMNSYKKAPMSEIADTAEISKSLLFHYFKNKKELYMYLWVNAMELTRKSARLYETTQTTDFFEMLKRNLFAKCSLMREYPYIYQFSLQAYYETEPDIKESVQASFSEVIQTSEHLIFETMDTTSLRSDIDIGMMYQEILYAVDGYMLNKYRSGTVNADEIEKEFEVLIDFWKKVYTRN